MPSGSLRFKHYSREHCFIHKWSLLYVLQWRIQKRAGPKFAVYRQDSIQCNVILLNSHNYTGVKSSCLDQVLSFSWCSTRVHTCYIQCTYACMFESDWTIRGIVHMHNKIIHTCMAKQTEVAFKKEGALDPPLYYSVLSGANLTHHATIV